MNMARAMLALSATSRNSTSPAPTAASVSMKKSDQAAPARAGWPRSSDRLVHTTSTTTAMSARPLVARCENSTSVCTLGDRGEPRCRAAAGGHTPRRSRSRARTRPRG